MIKLFTCFVYYSHKIDDAKDDAQGPPQKKEIKKN